MKQPFRVVRHIHQALPNETVKQFFTYVDAVVYLRLITDRNQKSDGKKHWIECLCVDGEWYGVA